MTKKKECTYIVHTKEGVQKTIILPYDHTEQDLINAMSKVLGKEIVKLDAKLLNGEWYDIH